MDLDCVLTAFHPAIGDVQLGHRGLHVDGLTMAAQPSVMVKHVPRTFDSQFPKNTSAIGDVRIPIFSSLRATFIPGESFSMRNALIPSGPRALSIVANTTRRSATGP